MTSTSAGYNIDSIMSLDYEVRSLVPGVTHVLRGLLRCSESQVRCNFLLKSVLIC